MNGLRITIIEGDTLDRSTEFFFDATREYIVLGCDPTMCQVVFTEDFREHGVGNEHIAFKRSLGRYQIDLNTDHYVELDGATPFEDQEITGITRIKLGNRVQLEVEVIDKRASTSKVGKSHVQPGQQVRHNRKILWGALAAIACVAVGLIYINSDVSQVRESVADVDSSITNAIGDLDQLSKQLTQLESGFGDITQQTINTVSQSVYLVLKQDRNGGETPQGTAWVTEQQKLATNAHVADAFNRLKPGEQLVARSSTSPYRTYQVKRALLHPGFKRYQNLWGRYLPTQKSNNKLTLMQTVMPADVALLELYQTEGLGQPLPLANLDELNNLQPGMNVGYVGYPVENLLPGSFQTPVPVAQQDELVRITDFFMVKQASNINRLIQHGIPLTGGASGSPMFNADGKVIGLISGMNIARGSRGRIVNAADINFAQRVDFLHDLLKDGAQSAMPRLETQWTKGFKEFIPAQSGSVDAIRNAMQRLFNLPKPQQTQRINESVPASRRFGRSSVVTKKQLSLLQPGVHIISVISNASKYKIKLSLPKANNASQYYRRIPYSNFADYKILVIDEPVTITATLTFNKPLYAKQDIKYQLAIESWAKPITESAKALALSSAAKNARLIKQARNIRRLQLVNGQYMAGFDLTMDKPGRYTFLAVPKGTGSVNALLSNQGGKIIRRDRSTNAIAMMHYDHKKEQPQTISFVSYTPQNTTTQDMYVYYSPVKQSIK